MKTLKHKIDLKREDNKSYYKIVDEYNILARKISFVNEKILNFKNPKLFLLCNKYRINSYTNSLKKLQILVDTWSNSYNRFIDKPSLTFSENEERELGFIHFMRLLETMDARVNRVFDTTVVNFIKIQERHSNQVNFIIAIISVFLSLLGLAIAICTMGYK